MWERVFGEVRGEAMMGELWKEGDSGGVLGGEGRGVNTKRWVWVR